MNSFNLYMNSWIEGISLSKEDRVMIVGDSDEQILKRDDMKMEIRTM